MPTHFTRFLWPLALLLLLSGFPAEAKENELKAWLEGLRAIPARDAEPLTQWRRRYENLAAHLTRLSKAPPSPLQAGALRALAALSLDPAPLPPGPERKRVALRVTLVRALEAGELSPARAAALDATQGELLRELAADPLGGPWRGAALRALGGRPSGRATLRLVARQGGTPFTHALAGLRSLEDARGVVEALEAALERGQPTQAQRTLEILKALEGRLPLDRTRSYLLGEHPADAKATLARALADLGWQSTRGALRRLLREPGLPRGSRVAVTVSYLRLGGEPAELGPEVALLASAALEPGALGREAFTGLTRLPATTTSHALLSELRNPDPTGARRARVVQAAEALALKDLAPNLRELARDASQPLLTRAAAAHALGTFGRPEDQAALVALARDPAPSLRRGALEALVGIPRPRRITAAPLALTGALSDVEPAVRRVALEALDAPSDVALLELALSRRKGRPNLVDPREVQTWLERATSLALSNPSAASWLLSRWRSRPALRTSGPLGLATIRYARGLNAPLATPTLLDLLEHSSREVTRAAQAALAQRYPSGKGYGGDPARWRRAWRGHPALFR